MIDVELSKVRGLLRDKEVKLKKTEDVLLALNEDIVYVKKRWWLAVMICNGHDDGHDDDDDDDESR